MLNRSIVAVPLCALLLSACVVVPAGRGYGVDVGIAVPALPLIVELASDGYFVYGGYTYYYDNRRWRYAASRSGPWADLPPSHYPKETRYRDRSDDRRKDRDRGGDRTPDRSPDRYR